MNSLYFSPPAVQDLDEIRAYIAEDDPNAASRFVQSIEAICAILAENPMLGRLRTELAPSLRSFPVGNYMLFYLPSEEGIEIVRVVSGFRDVDALF